MPVARESWASDRPRSSLSRLSRATSPGVCSIGSPLSRVSSTTWVEDIADTACQRQIGVSRRRSGRLTEGGDGIAM